MDSSCPGLTRASIEKKRFFQGGVDCRVKLGNDGVGSEIGSKSFAVSDDPRMTDCESSMCDYSLDLVASRPAKVGDKLVTTEFQNSMTRGFAAIGEPNVAVCLLPGTEIAFENEVEYERFFVLLPNIKLGTKVARFRQINVGRPMVHHDALEFPDGETVLLTRMCEGQHATVLQLPASGRPVNAAEGQKRDSLVR
jgi:hypothetical protein